MQPATHAKRNGIQAVEVATSVLTALGTMRRAAQLKEIAQLTNMQPAKVHRYLVSLIRAGYAEQDQETGLYGLGPAAVQLGIASIEANNVVGRAGRVLRKICLELHVSGHLTIWGAQGPVVIRNEHGGPPIISTMGLGAAMPLLRSATGRTFLSFMPRAATQAVLEREMERFGTTPHEVDDIVSSIQARGLSRISGEFIPGLSALSAPVFGIDGNLQCALTLISTDPETLSAEGHAEALLLEKTGKLSFMPNSE